MRALVEAYHPALLVSARRAEGPSTYTAGIRSRTSTWDMAVFLRKNDVRAPGSRELRKCVGQGRAVAIHTETAPATLTSEENDMNVEHSWVVGREGERSKET